MPKKPSLAEIEAVVNELVIPFYHSDRDMIIPGEVRRNENDAEHSWSLAFLGCALAPQIDPDLDVGKVAQLALVHDLPEVYTGDVSVWDDPEKLALKKEQEAEAMKTLAERFSNWPWIASTVEEYEQKESKEAQFVYALDKLLPLFIRKIDNGQAYIDRQLTKESFLDGLTPSRSKAQAHPAIGEYFEELWVIFETRPEYFYQPPG